jgi:hypothetical protein
MCKAYLLLAYIPVYFTSLDSQYLETWSKYLCIKGIYLEIDNYFQIPNNGIICAFIKNAMYQSSHLCKKGISHN